MPLENPRSITAALARTRFFITILPPPDGLDPFNPYFPCDSFSFIFCNSSISLFSVQ